MTMPIGGGMMSPQQQFQSPASMNATATNDVQFNQTVSQALNAAFGADPATGQVMPGPIAHLMDRMHGDFNRSGLSGLGGLFPTGMNGQTGTQAGMPPLLTGGMGADFPGTGALVNSPFQGGNGVGNQLNVGGTNPFSNVQGGNAMPAAASARKPSASHQFSPVMQGGMAAMMFQLAGMMMLMIQSMGQSMGQGMGQGKSASA